MADWENLGKPQSSEYAAPTLEPPKACHQPSARRTHQAPGRCKTRSGAEYSPFANAIALRLPDVCLAQLLERRDNGPDSDTDSLDESDNDLEPPAPPREPAPGATPTLPLRPATFIRVAPPGHLPGTRLPNGLMLGSVIRVARQVPPPKKASSAEIKARCLLKKHARDRAARSLEREVLRTKAGSRLKGITRQLSVEPNGRRGGQYNGGFTEKFTFLYFLFVALDACFRLKRRLVSSELRDPGLGIGWAYFVEQETYRAYLLTKTNETEMSTCSGLAALDYANTKFSRGYSTTGVGMGVCARHEFVQPTGVSDLKKGERYSNMDWIYSAFRRWKHERLTKVASYDIICQWFKKLFEWLRNMPSTVRFVVVTELMRFIIPKMHIHSPRVKQVLFSLNFLLGAGQTDGEGIERPWANLGSVATSTREMGPGARRDTLNSHLGYWNWSKLIGLADLLRTRLDKAKVEEREQSEAFEAFTQEQGGADGGLAEDGMTEADVHLRLSEEEQEKGGPSLHDVSPSGFIYAGLDLEDQQRRVRVNIELKKAQTTAQKIDIATYTPGALQALARRPVEPDETPEKTPLMLPLALATEERGAGCVGEVAIYEAVARDAQCDAALLHLRHQLHIKSRFLVYKRSHLCHQGANTQSRTLVARNESKIRPHCEKYQAAWNAIRQLHGGDARKVGWRRLVQSDIRLMEDAEDLRKREERRKQGEARRRARTRQLIAEGEHVEEDDGDDAWEDDDGDGATTTESRCVVSWIWTVAGTTGPDAELKEGLRIEWAKVYARSRRWKEEIHLLEEEQQRLLVSLEHEARAGRDVIKVGEVEAGFAQGAIAYALRQAAMYRDIAARAVITATEVRHGRGKKRTRAVVVEDVAGEEEADGGGGSD
ncbi:hypothetical protein C8F04DRAFT_1284627, partial [Mycena alexandri]